MQNVVSDNVILGNNSGAGSVVEELTGSEVKTLIGLGNVTNDAQVKKESSVTDGRVAIWDGTTGDALKDTGNATINGDLTVVGNIISESCQGVDLAGSTTLTYSTHHDRWLRVGGTGVRTITIDSTFNTAAPVDTTFHIENTSTTGTDLIQVSVPGGTTLIGIGNNLDVSANGVATVRKTSSTTYRIFGDTE